MFVGFGTNVDTRVRTSENACFRGCSMISTKIVTFVDMPQANEKRKPWGLNTFSTLSRRCVHARIDICDNARVHQASDPFNLC